MEQKMCIKQYQITNTSSLPQTHEAGTARGVTNDFQGDGEK
jgi:hypothetical protein